MKKGNRIADERKGKKTKRGGRKKKGTSRGKVAVNLKKRETEKRIGSTGREGKETRRGKREWNWNRRERKRHKERERCREMRKRQRKGKKEVSDRLQNKLRKREGWLWVFVGG